MYVKQLNLSKITIFFLYTFIPKLGIITINLSLIRYFITLAKSIDATTIDFIN